MPTPVSTTPSLPRAGRAIWIVLDGVGCGALPDATEYSDVGSDSLGNLSRQFRIQNKRPLHIPNLRSLGIDSLTTLDLEGSAPATNLEAGWIVGHGKATELSQGKDTTSGHWEMAGLPVSKAFPTFPNGFSPEIIARWCKENDLPGVLGNCVASGTEIIDRFGAEHLKTGKPIVYTSADSVWQVAAHEQSFGLERLYSVCVSARKICDELGIGRVIARPFIGNPDEGTPFKRTYHRKDYASPPTGKTVLNLLQQERVPVLGIGKIASIFHYEGVPENIDTAGNEDGLKVLIEQVQNPNRHGLIYCNLIDFDMLYGHRRDVMGYALALEAFDQMLPKIQQHMRDGDFLVITSDHGNDPTFRGTDHTREYIPVLVALRAQGSKSQKIDLGIRRSFGDLGASVFESLTGQLPQTLASELVGTSFYCNLVHPGQQS